MLHGSFLTSQILSIWKPCSKAHTAHGPNNAPPVPSLRLIYLSSSVGRPLPPFPSFCPPLPGPSCTCSVGTRLSLPYTWGESACSQSGPAANPRTADRPILCGHVCSPGPDCRGPRHSGLPQDTFPSRRRQVRGQRRVSYTQAAQRGHRPPTARRVSASALSQSPRSRPRSRPRARGQHVCVSKDLLTGHTDIPVLLLKSVKGTAITS